MTEVTSYLFPPEARLQDTLSLHEPEVIIDISGGGRGDCVHLITPPKSGTHMIRKILCLLGISYKNNTEGFHFSPHLTEHSDELIENCTDIEVVRKVFDNDTKYIITIRDPKDFVVSLIKWVDKRIETGHSPMEKRWVEASMEQKLDSFFLDEEETYYESIQLGYWAMTNYYIASKLYQLGLNNILFLKFEDLIGPEMGGSPKEVQLRAFKKLCDFTGTKYTEEKIQKLIEALPGNTYTYIDQKKVGKWEDVYLDRHKFYFNRYFSQITLDLGYSPIDKDSFSYSPEAKI